MVARVYIVGHMGAGKFVFSEALANKLGWEVIDANPSIERYIGRHTSEILGEDGEAAFNRSQADIISSTKHKSNIVVLLEECVVTSAQCRNLLATEFVIYLRTTINTQLERMKHGRIPALPIADMNHFLEVQHLERDPLYEKVATLIIDSFGHPDQDTDINSILEKDINSVLMAIRK